ncbi:hypothetical protein MRX96_018816 [Rhipicephalus microplus]
MDFSNSRKRLREESGDEDDHAPRKQMATTPSESSEEESHTSQGSEEMSGSECRTTVDSKVASTTVDMTSSATTGGTDPASWDGAGTCQLPTTASPNDLPPQRRPSPHTEGLPLPAASPQGVESTLPAPAAEGTTDSPDNPPPCRFSCHGGPHCSGHHKEAQQCSGESPRHRGLPGITTRSARRRARDLAAAALPVNPAIVGTVLFRSSAPGDTFSGSPRLILAQALSARPGVAAIPVNQKRNIVAADATTRECLEQLLTIKELKGIPVTAKEPADHKTSTGGRTVTLRFAGLVPPEHVSLFLERFPVRPTRPRPLQCRQCDTPECPPVAGAAEGCHYHCIFPNHPLEACSDSGGARGNSGDADLCEGGEGPHFTAPPPLRPDSSRHLANLVTSQSRDSSPLALLPLWPFRQPLLFPRPRLLQLPISRPSLLLLSPEAGLLYPWLLWPRLLRQ